MLFCDTCALVFHALCIRPKMDSVPKGSWSCPHCIVAGTVTSSTLMSVAQAKAALIAMNRLTRGIDSYDDDVRSTKTGEITISRSGRRFVVRKTAKSQIVELDRCNLLEEALVAVVVAQNSNLSKRSYKGSNEKEELWCVYCLDDPSVVLCAFCGCRQCFGKHDSDTLLVCDGCDDEWHTTCLPKPLDCVPDAAWYCGACIDSGRNDAEESLSLAPSSSSSSSSSKSNSNSHQPLQQQQQQYAKTGASAAIYKAARPFKISAHAHNPGRGRGRPPGSNSKKYGAGDSSQPTLGSPIDAMGMGMGAGTAFDADFMSTAFGGGDSSGADAAGPASAFSSDNFDFGHRHRTPPLPQPLRAAGYEEAINIILGYPAAGGGDGDGDGDGSDALDFDALATSSSCHNPKLGALRPAERDLLAQVRVWAPLGDLEVTRSALAGQCASIYKRILELDPSFKFNGHGVVGLSDESNPGDDLLFNNGDVGSLGLGNGIIEEEEDDDDDDDDADDDNLMNFALDAMRHK